MSLAESVGAMGRLSDLVSVNGGLIMPPIIPAIRFRIMNIIKIHKAIMISGMIHHHSNTKHGP